MKRNITFKEAMAWILLAGAVFLLSAAIALAQEKKPSKKNTTTIKIVKTEDGKTTKIDTTFDSTDEGAIEDVLKDLGIEHDMHFDFDVPEPPDAAGTDDNVMRLHGKGMSKEDREKLKKEMENLKEEMGDLHEKLKDLHIEIFSDKDGQDSDGYSYNYNFTMPPIPPMTDEDFNFSGDWKGKTHHRYFFHYPDSLNDDDHAIIIGGEDEKAPVFEKEITGKHGEKIFVFKRSKTQNRKSEEDNPERDKINLYPNPNNGKFSLRFHSDKSNELSVKVYDTQGKEVYSETIEDFDGDYFNQLDLTEKGKGNYILKIIQGTKTMTEKFVIE